jgi:hypothetical protein
MGLFLTHPHFRFDHCIHHQRLETLCYHVDFTIVLSFLKSVLPNFIQTLNIKNKLLFFSASKDHATVLTPINVRNIIRITQDHSLNLNQILFESKQDT